MKLSAYQILRRGWFILAALVVVTFTACRSTSSLYGPHGAVLTPTRKFSKVTVQDFEVQVAKHAEQAAPARVSFPDFIVSEIGKTGRFSSVARNAEPDRNTLVIKGVVTRYGNVQKRLWLGMGFGRSFLEADVEFCDSKGVTIGRIRVDRKSWPLGGGGVTAGQNPQSFMYGAAGKIAQEAARMAK